MARTYHPAPGVDRLAVRQFDRRHEVVADLEHTVHRQEIAGGQRHADAETRLAGKVIGVEEQPQAIGIALAVGLDRQQVGHRPRDHAQTQTMRVDRVQLHQQRSAVEVGRVGRPRRAVAEQARRLAKAAGDLTGGDQVERVAELRPVRCSPGDADDGQRG